MRHYVDRRSGWALVGLVLLSCLLVTAWIRFGGASSEGAGDERALSEIASLANSQKTARLQVRAAPDQDTARRPAQLALAQAPSLDGTELDGALRMDAQGRLLQDRELRRLFDHLLAGMGEISLEALRARLRAHALGIGGEALAAQAMAAFEQYLDYLRRESELALPAADLAARLEALMALRRDVFGDELTEALFGEEERYALDALTRLEGGDGLADAPESERWQAERAEATEHLLALEQTQQFEQLDLSPQQRFEERSDLYGEDAAARLAALDAERGRWQQRLDEWHALRDTILNNEALDAAARERELQALRERLFDEAEQRRVQALEDVSP